MSSETHRMFGQWQPMNWMNYSYLEKQKGSNVVLLTLHIYD